MSPLATRTGLLPSTALVKALTLSSSCSSVKLTYHNPNTQSRYTKGWRAARLSGRDTHKKRTVIGVQLVALKAETQKSSMKVANSKRQQREM